MKDAKGHGSAAHQSGIEAARSVPNNALMAKSNSAVTRRLRNLGPVSEPAEVMFSRMVREAESGAVNRGKSLQTGEAFR